MIVTPLQYATALNRALKEDRNVEEVCKEFALLLSERGDTGKIREIERAYEALRASQGNELNVSILSGQPTKEHLFPKELGGKKVREEERVDAALIGGVRVRMNDILVDTTIARRLHDLKSALK